MINRIIDAIVATSWLLARCFSLIIDPVACWNLDSDANTAFASLRPILNIDTVVGTTACCDLAFHSKTVVDNAA